MNHGFVCRFCSSRCTKKGRCVSVRLTAITLVWIVLLTYAQELIELDCRRSACRRLNISGVPPGTLEMEEVYGRGY